MFYSHSLLSRRGPFGNIWIAAYCFKKLKREQIADTDIISSIEKIIPESGISYRVLAQLLLGIVRIFSKKVDYLYHDCNDALTNITKSLVPAVSTVKTKAVAGKQPNATVPKKVSHASKVSVTASKDGSPAMQMEAMRAPQHHVIITVPQRFELDSFDLDVLDGGGTDKNHRHSVFEDDWTNERDQASFLNECDSWETFAYTGNNSACFTPVDDVLPSHMMDMDLEINELYNPSSLEGRMQKVQEEQHLEVSINHESLVDRMSLRGGKPEYQVHLVKLQDTAPLHIEKKVQIEEPKDQVEPINLLDVKAAQNEKAHAYAEGQQDTTTPAKSHDKSSFPCDSGLPSPTFMVTTPAKREGPRPRMSRKRKNIFDETIVLPNEILRMGIHDASDLVRKRMKAPHTFLDDWKARRITNLQENFMEPLIPCISLEFESLLQKKSFYQFPGSFVDTDNGQNEILNTPSHIDYSANTLTPNFIQDKTPVTKPSDGSLQEKYSGNTLTPADYSEVQSTTKSYEMSIKKSSTTDSSDSGSDLMEEIVTDPMGANNQDDGWSIRTRAVARYLCKRFLDLKEQKQKEILSLARILKGKTRAKCARLFYETLALKNHGCIDVQQVSSYSDIVISPTPQLEAMLVNR